MAARRLASSIRHVSAKTTPLLILHSDNDGSVPVQQAQEMAKALEEAKARHRLSVYQKKGHMRITEDVINESRAFIEEIGKSKLPVGGGLGERLGLVLRLGWFEDKKTEREVWSERLVGRLPVID